MYANQLMEIYGMFNDVRFLQNFQDGYSFGDAFNSNRCTTYCYNNEGPVMVIIRSIFKQANK